MANENKWEYDYSNIYHKASTPNSYTNVGSSGTNTANSQVDGAYFEQAPTPVQPASVQPVGQPMAEPLQGETTVPEHVAVPTGAVGGMPPPPPPSYYNGAARGQEKPTRHAKKKKHSVLRRVISSVFMLILVAGVGFAGGYVGNMYAALNSDSMVLVQQVTRDTSELTSISTSTDGEDLSLVSAAAIASQSVVVITTEELVATSGWYGTEAVESGAGSGVIISEDGYILTCAHVVSGASNIIVTVGEDDYAATVIGSDEETDIAVIKIEATGLTAAVLGDSDALSVGESIIAVGNPLGVLGGSVTQGIVSALNRVIVVENYEMTLIQMDASVSPGNSGGGLFNMAGELVGIVNAKSSDSDSEGIGFAIPINTAFELATSLIENGYITGRPELGIIAVSITDAETAAAYGVSSVGIYVYSVNEGSSAQAAGLQAGDRLISIEDTEISVLTDLTDVIDSMEVGDVVSLLIARNGQMMTATVTLGEQGASTATTPDTTTAQETTPEESVTNPDSGYTFPDSGSTMPDSGTTTPDSSTTMPDSSAMMPRTW